MLYSKLEPFQSILNMSFKHGSKAFVSNPIFCLSTLNEDLQHFHTMGALIVPSNIWLMMHSTGTSILEMFQKILLTSFTGVPGLKG